MYRLQIFKHIFVTYILIFSFTYLICFLKLLIYFQNEKMFKINK